MAINTLAHDVLILGGGHAGVRAARQLNYFGGKSHGTTISDYE